MVGQWTEQTGRARLLAAAVGCASALMLAGCISDEQAVDMGVATRCEGSTTFAALGNPGTALTGEASARFLRGDRVELCRGVRRDAGSRTQIIVVDCATQAQLTATVAQAMADPARRGPDFDLRSAAEQQLLRLQMGLTDLQGVQTGLQSAGIQSSLQAGAGAAQCINVGAAASAQN